MDKSVGQLVKALSDRQMQKTDKNKNNRKINRLSLLNFICLINHVSVKNQTEIVFKIKEIEAQKCAFGVSLLDWFLFSTLVLMAGAFCTILVMHFMHVEPASFLLIILRSFRSGLLQSFPFLWRLIFLLGSLLVLSFLAFGDAVLLFFRGHTVPHFLEMLFIVIAHFGVVLLVFVFILLGISRFGSLVIAVTLGICGFVSVSMLDIFSHHANLKPNIYTLREHIIVFN